jgi:hypothetical protein
MRSAVILMMHERMDVLHALLSLFEELGTSILFFLVHILRLARKGSYIMSN